MVTISGKISFFRGKYQITNPTYVSTDKNKVKKIHSSYSLTEGISDNIFNKIVNEAIINLPKIKEWHNNDVLKILENVSWNDAIFNIHKPHNKSDEKIY